jgi:Domain of unknown function (DUF5076)
MNELAVPPAAQTDPAARELVRAWAASGAQHVSLATGIWSDPAAWGMFLVDLAKHVANAYEQTEGHDYGETLARIRTGFDAEWAAPTDEPFGRIANDDD